jgi:hypothetical protein
MSDDMSGTWAGLRDGRSQRAASGSVDRWRSGGMIFAFDVDPPGDA